MLIKTEKILTRDNTLLDDKDDAEIFGMVRKELTEKIVKDLIENQLIKVQITNEINDDFGSLCKVRASVRAYNPDA